MLSRFIASTCFQPAPVGWLHLFPAGSCWMAGMFLVLRSPDAVCKWPRFSVCRHSSTAGLARRGLPSCTTGEWGSTAGGWGSTAARLEGVTAHDQTGVFGGTVVPPY